ncbi:MAG: hypothetical protein C4525_14115 [Desulfarculus sp.]|jgi:DNA modification methylase|nr:MAG: hypothetical protein C4525_14115 [Desulfarculus sp.]
MKQASSKVRVFDPFCGTATTALSAAYHGHDAATTDINPFLVWLARAKTARYSYATVSRTRKACEDALALVGAGEIDPAQVPPIHNIERWWHADALAFLGDLRAAIECTMPFQTQEGTLLCVAFCRTLIACSNAAFNHQSMSFKNSSQLTLGIQYEFKEIFRDNLEFVLRGALQNPTGEVETILHDARLLSRLKLEPFGLVITSPPYANRMSYIRELRPYMYWLGFLQKPQDAGELDWLAIGGTWGIATSRLNKWKPARNRCNSERLERTLDSISSPCNANGKLLANYIRKYVNDIYEHLAELRTILASGASIHYIVGNSTFYGELLPVELIYAQILDEIGFNNIEVRPIRKRNSKKELIEFDVSASWL